MSGWIPRDADDTADLRATVRKLAALLDEQAEKFAAALSRQEAIAQAARAYVAARELDRELMRRRAQGDEDVDPDLDITPAFVAAQAAYEALAAAVRGEQP